MLFIICFTMRGKHNGVGLRHASIYEPGKKLPTWFKKRRFTQGTTTSKFVINPKPQPTGTNSPNSKFTAEERAECLRLIADGMSKYQVAKVFGVARTTIIRWLKQAKFFRKDSGHVKAQVERMVAMHKSGMSQNAIAKELGITQGAVSRRLKPYSQKVQQCTLTKEQVEQMVAMCQAGMSQDAIAKRFGVSQGTVSRQLKKTVQPCS